MATVARRRWYQFRLRTLLLGVMLVALVVMAYRTYVEPYAQQRRAMEVIEKLGGAYQSSGPTAWQRRLFGADHQNLQLVNLADCDDPNRYLSYIAPLPAIQTLVVGGEAFTDAHLRRLSGLGTLRTLILDSTAVSEETLAAWRERLPEVRVYRSQRRALRQLQSSGWKFVGRVSSSGWSLASEGPPQSTLAEIVGPAFFSEVHVAIGCPTDDVGLLPLRHLTTLRTLSLADTKITDAGLQHLRHLAQLGYLDLTGTLVTDGGLTELKRFADLKYLDLAGTAVTDDGLQHVRTLPKLGWLNLNRTKVTHAGIVQHVVPVKSLRMLCLEDAGVSREEAAALNESMQPCAVLGPAAPRPGAAKPR